MPRSRVLLKGFMVMMLFTTTTAAWGKLEIPTLIGDHMVFQQQMPAVVWGKDSKGQKVTVSIAGQSGSAIANSNGDWKVELPALPAGGPYELTVAGSDSVTFNDVLVGEVWVASGQSNMELAMNITHDAAKTIPEATDSKIHFFMQVRASSDKPLTKTVGSWQVCSPETIKTFSAVAYHFARNLRENMSVPVGLVGSYWGGTIIESWTPAEKLKSSADFKPALDRWAAKPEVERNFWVKGMDSRLEIAGVKLVPKDASAKPAAILMKLDANADGSNTFGGNWSGNAAPGSTITFSTKDSGGPVSGPIGIVTGHFLGGAWGSVAAPFKADGSAVDLSSYQAVEFYARGSGKFSANTAQPTITDFDNYGSEPFELTSDWKLHTIPLSSLKQAGWGFHKPFTQEALQTMIFSVVLPGAQPEAPSVMYNAMIAPLTPLRIRGALWYQGESNEGRPAEYQKLLPGLIQSWRKAWGEGDFPFFVAQLPNYKAVQPEPGNSAWAELREAQAMALKEPKTGMAVLIDLGDANDIHPKNKTDVGYRLAQAVLPVAYGKPGVVSPLYDSITIEGKKVRVQFTNAEKGLQIKGGGDMKGFAIAGADGKFQWAETKIDGTSVLVWSDQVSAPTAVRYAWADNPICNLFGKNGLPVSPFRTDGPQSEKK